MFISPQYFKYFKYLYPRGWRGVGYSDISYIRRLGSFFGVQNFEFQYFLGFSENDFFFFFGGGGGV